LGDWYSNRIGQYETINQYEMWSLYQCHAKTKGTLYILLNKLPSYIVYPLIEKSHSCPQFCCFLCAKNTCTLWGLDQLSPHVQAASVPKAISVLLPFCILQSLKLAVLTFCKLCYARNNSVPLIL